MDGSIRAVRPYANRGEKEGVAFLGLNPRPITLGVEVSVMILYADAVVAAGLAAVLREHGGFQEAFALVSKEQDDHDGARGRYGSSRVMIRLLTSSPTRL
jgi:hypothetical protein